MGDTAGRGRRPLVRAGGVGAGDGRRSWPASRTRPFLRAALASDVTNLLANSGDRGLGYINADLTLYLARPPVGEWIGCEATDHADAEGVAFGSSSLYDRDGRIGHVALCAVADRRLVTPGSARSTGVAESPDVGLARSARRRRR